MNALRRAGLVAAGLVAGAGMGLFIVLSWAQLGAPGHQWLGWP